MMLADLLRPQYTHIRIASQDIFVKNLHFYIFFAICTLSCSRKYLHSPVPCANIRPARRKSLQISGWVAERFNAAVLKTAEG